MLSEAPSGRPRRGDAVAPNALRRFGPRAVCRVPPPYPTPPCPGSRREGARERRPLLSSALLRAALRQAAFGPQAWWHPESALAIICKKAIPAANLVKKSGEM